MIHLSTAKRSAENHIALKIQNLTFLNDFDLFSFYVNGGHQKLEILLCLL